MARMCFLELERPGFKPWPILLADYMTGNLTSLSPNFPKYKIKLKILISTYHKVCLKGILICIQPKRDLMVKCIWRTFQNLPLI